MPTQWNEAELARLFNSEDGPVGKMLTRKAVVVEAAAKRSVKAHGRGRVYRLSNPSRTHQASAPGDPPATDLGRLGASITHALGHDDRGLLSWVGSNVSYAPHLERGTTRMAPRPFLRPALSALRGIR